MNNESQKAMKAVRGRRGRSYVAGHTQPFAAPPSNPPPGSHPVEGCSGSGTDVPPTGKRVVKEQDYRDLGYNNTTRKQLTVRWTPGHRKLSQAMTYQDYLDINGNNTSNELANMGDNLPMEFPRPRPYNTVLHGQIMPTPVKSWIMQLHGQTMPSLVKSWIMQLHRQKHMAEVHWVS